MQYIVNGEKLATAARMGSDINGIIVLAVLLFVAMFLSWFFYETRHMHL